MSSSLVVDTELYPFSLAGGGGGGGQGVSHRLSIGNIHEVKKRENCFTKFLTHSLSSKKVLSRAVLSYLGLK